MIKEHEKLPHLTTFLSHSVQEELLANARRRRMDDTFLMHTGLRILTDRKILSMIQYTVRDNFITDPAPEGGIISENTGVLHSALARYKVKFVTRLKFSY